MEASGIRELVKLLQSTRQERFDSGTANTLSDVDRRQIVSEAFERAEKFGLLKQQPAEWTEAEEHEYQQTLRDASAKIVEDLKARNQAANAIAEKFKKLPSMVSQSDTVRNAKYSGAEDKVDLESADFKCVQYLRCEDAVYDLSAAYKHVQEQKQQMRNMWREKGTNAVKKL